VLVSALTNPYVTELRNQRLMSGERSPFEILLVEDNPADIRLIKEALRSCRIPHHLQTVGDGQSALDLMFSCNGQPTCPDLVILDLNLPTLTGHEVLQAVKADQRTACVPVIVMSSSDSVSDVRRAYEFHANCYVRKPGSLEDLFRVVTAIEAFWMTTVELPPHVSTK
jgi:two-component system, chemotaxis family, response regulator Rcp1